MDSEQKDAGDHTEFAMDVLTPVSDDTHDWEPVIRQKLDTPEVLAMAVSDAEDVETQAWSSHSNHMNIAHTPGFCCGNMRQAARWKRIAKKHRRKQRDILAKVNFRNRSSEDPDIAYLRYVDNKLPSRLTKKQHQRKKTCKKKALGQEVKEVLY